MRVFNFIVVGNILFRQLIVALKPFISANDPPVKYKLDKLLGNGTFSSVYSLVSCDEMKESNDLVAKVFKNEEYFENEQKIMDIIAKKRHNHEGG